MLLPNEPFRLLHLRAVGYSVFEGCRIPLIVMCTCMIGGIRVDAFTFVCEMTLFDLILVHTSLRTRSSLIVVYPLYLLELRSSTIFILIFVVKNQLSILERDCKSHDNL